MARRRRAVRSPSPASARAAGPAANGNSDAWRSAIEELAGAKSSRLLGPEALAGQVCVVTGCNGMFGHRLCLSLLRAGAAEVRGLDLHLPDESQMLARTTKCRMRYFTGSVTSEGDLQRVLGDTATVVFHVASFGMSGVEMLNRDRTRAVNVGGTETLIRCCLRAVCVRALVYTSSYNVTFGGQEVVLGDESLGYFPLDKHADEYSRTKAEAEQLVLQANGQQQLRSVALRAAAIYGEGECRHFPRIIRTMRRGLYNFTIGASSNQCDWVHVDNLVHAHLLGAVALLRSSKSTTAAATAAAGEAFFISDENPINNFAFLAPICDLVGIQQPKLCLPTWFAYAIAYLLEALYALALFLSCGMIAVPAPLLSRAEVLKVGVSHTFSTARARSQLGYAPVVQADEGQRRLVADLAHRFPREPLWWERWGLAAIIGTDRSTGGSQMVAAMERAMADCRGALDGELDHE